MFSFLCSSSSSLYSSCSLLCVPTRPCSSSLLILFFYPLHILSVIFIIQLPFSFLLPIFVFLPSIPSFAWALSLPYPSAISVFCLAITVSLRLSAPPVASLLAAVLHSFSFFFFFLFFASELFPSLASLPLRSSGFLISINHALTRQEPPRSTTAPFPVPSEE